MKGAAFALLLLLTVPRSAVAQDALVEARANYEAASYEEALASLARVGEAAPVSRAEIEQYRALCFLALGNVAEAERAVSALVDADPNYHVPASVASPKVLSAIAEMRRKQLPAVARRLLNEGRAAYENKEFARARQQFEMLVSVVADPAMDGSPERDDLQSLARGFVTLVNAAPAEANAAPKGTSAASGASGESAAAPPSRQADVYVAPAAISQPMPRWEPPSVSVAKFQYSGTLKVRIGADGTVKEAIIEKPSHPAYDSRLLEAAKSWTFKPATLNGMPIESEKTFAIQLRPVK